MFYLLSVPGRIFPRKDFHAPAPVMKTRSKNSASAAKRCLTAKITGTRRKRTMVLADSCSLIKSAMGGLVL